MRPRHDGPPARKRLFDYGEIRLLILAMVADRPRHGYEIIKDIEERFQGRYSPSPGVVYPTLAWLEDMGYVTIEPAGGGRKQTVISAEGRAFLAANRAAADDLLQRRAPCRPAGIPPEIERAMDALKAALRAELGTRQPTRIAAIAAAIEAAADTIRSGQGPDAEG